MNKRLMDQFEKLTLEEKASLLSGKNFWFTKDIPHLGIPSIMMTDGPHGLRKQQGDADHVGLNDSVPATCFPTASLLASTWDETLLQEVGQALGVECRNENVSILLGPGANIKRHPLCGRNFEYFSEDPLLSGKMASAWINGIQNEGIGASLKHFVANNQESMRMVVDTIVDDRTLRELYLKSFEIAVKEAQPWSVMCSYNKVNGTYLSEHQRLLDQILKQEWRHEGIVVTDWGACNNRVQGVFAGQDLEMPNSGGYNDARIVEAVQSGDLEESIVDQRVKAVLHMVDKATHTLAVSPPPFDPETHHQLARRVAAEGMVLLQNNDNVLPLDPHKTTALIGAFAKEPRYQGAGSSRIRPTKLGLAYDAFADVLQDTFLYAKGYDPNTDEIDSNLIDEAVAIAQQADQVVLMVGLTSAFESEGFDREHLHLPTNHTALIEAIALTDATIVVALSNGAPVVMPWSEQVDAILEQYLGGQAAGEALADVVFGNVNPAGRLAETFPNHLSEFPANQHFPGTNKQVEYREGLYVGYRAYDSMNIEPLFPFGFGLSYSTFQYDHIIVSLTEDDILIQVDITNTSNLDGKDVLQVYASKQNSVIYRPAQELIGFHKTLIPAQATKQVELNIPISRLAVYNGHEWKVERGPYQIHVARSSSNRLHTEELSVASRDELVPDSLMAYRNISSDFAPTKEEFEELLRRPIPHPSPARPFTTNSTFGEVKDTFVGQQLHKMIQKQLANVVGDDLDAVAQRMVERSIEEMPMRNLALLSGGRLSMNRLLGLIDLMNKRLLRGLWRLIRG